MIRSLLQCSCALLFALILTSCMIKHPVPTQVEVTNIPTHTLMPLVPSPTQPLPENVPPLPKLKTINWNDSLQPLLLNMLKSVNVMPGSILLVDRIKNSTNGALQIDKATWVIQSMLSNNGKFTMVSVNQLNKAKQTLHLALNDSLNSRSKLIGLARILNAQYALYVNAEGNVKSPTLQMQLMLVKTGEIIWSDNSVIHS